MFNIISGSYLAKNQFMLTVSEMNLGTTIIVGTENTEFHWMELKDK